MSHRLALYQLAQDHNLDAQATAHLMALAGHSGEPPAAARRVWQALALLAAALVGLIALLHLVLRIVPRPPTPHKPRPAFACPCCGKPMRILRRRLPPMAVSRPDSMQATETAV